MAKLSVFKLQRKDGFYANGVRFANGVEGVDVLCNKDGGAVSHAEHAALGADGRSYPAPAGKDKFSDWEVISEVEVTTEFVASCF